MTNSASSLIEGISRQKVRNELDRLDSEESLRGFIDRSWHILEPSREFSPGWHIDAVCEHLQAISNVLKYASLRKVQAIP